MTNRFSDSELLKMGVAKFHINRMHQEEIFDKAIEQTGKDFQLINSILGYEDDWSDDIKKIGKEIKRRF